MSFYFLQSLLFISLMVHSTRLFDIYTLLLRLSMIYFECPLSPPLSKLGLVCLILVSKRFYFPNAYYYFFALINDNDNLWT